MLTGLEILGFKSFPDRTRFEFPPGITVIVGPNGSGKSNVVDAIKWVLGEQSAKSLRGKEMTDVIFKGTGGAGGRKPANTAEATIILDNGSRLLRYDADEVRITRRVYRSGEGEYLINGEPVRLKDIRQLFRGTGMGTDAYSLIEQGKVDQLLQASAKDRRAMFEEAAGISRFKAKKVEAERRLARLQHNLVRLADIVEEVGSRYRSVRAQASKAARFREHSQRLQALRLHVARYDWRRFHGELADVGAARQAHQQLAVDLGARSTELDRHSEELDRQLTDVSVSIAECQAQLAETHQALAERQSEVALNSGRAADLAQRSVQLRGQLARLEERRAEQYARQQEITSQFASARELAEHRQRGVEAAESRIADLQNAAEAIRKSLESSRAAHTQCLLLATETAQRQTSGESQLQQTSELLARTVERAAHLAARLADAARARDAAQAEQQRLSAHAESKDSALKQARLECDTLRTTVKQAQDTLDQLRQALVGAVQRAEVIQEMEDRLEGIGSGAKQLMAAANEERLGLRAEIVGIVADLVRVHVQHANLVDVALGETAQYVVVRGPRTVELLARGELKITGRVGIIRWDQPPVLGAADLADLSDGEGVVGRLDDLVQCDGEHETFLRRLMGGTWLVKSLAAALKLHRTEGKYVRLVTLQGEVVEPDGTVVLGTRTSSLGLVSRRSELRALHREVNRLQEEAAHRQAELERLQCRNAAAEAVCESLLSEHTEIAARIADQRAKLASADLQCRELESIGQSTDVEAADLRRVWGEQQAGQTALVAQLHELETQAARHLESFHETERQSVANDTELRQMVEQVTADKIDLATVSQQVHQWSAKSDQLGRDIDELVAARREARNQLAATLRQRRAAVAVVARAQAELADLTAARNQRESEGAAWEIDRKKLAAARQTASADAARARDQLRSATEALHSLDLREKQLQMQATQLAERLREDYDIDLTHPLDDSTWPTLGPDAVPADRTAIDEEIADLRRKIGSIGPVNLDALAELESLQTRYEGLNSHYQDLNQARETLEKIIQRINNDCRRIYQETLDAIRTNFQQLFRQTFGGGRADLVLEEGVDVLEAGVEIVATPPGKPQFSNSLLSGGEKALTAVSLLLAIFKFRPSPFCILDEVDAPFDEANIGRFIEVLRSFLGWTRFVIVTHSKKTMTAANTLYGVTMQESGVSKRVSVRFEDVNEEGQITPVALDRPDATPATARGVA